MNILKSGHLSVRNPTKNKRNAVDLAVLALTSTSLAASFTPLTAISVASDKASIRLSRSEASASIRLYRLVRRSSSSSLAVATAVAFSSSAKEISPKTLAKCQFP